MMNFPKDNASFSWTRHIKNKMVFYHLSGAQILRIFRKPKRREEGVAPGTFAAMQPRAANGSLPTANRRTGERDPSGRQPSAVSRKRSQEELWIMYRINSRQTTYNRRQKATASSLIGSHKSPVKSRVTMISAWRYPGTTKPGERPHIPEDVLAELEEIA